MIEYADRYKTIQGSFFAAAEKELHELEMPMTHTFAHYHSDMELLFIDEGETIINVAGHSFLAGKDSLILVNPYEVHSGDAVSINYAHRCVCFDMKQLGLPDCDHFLSGELAYVNHIENAEELRSFFTNCYEAVKNRSDGWELRAKGNLLLMFSMLTQKISSAAPTKEQIFARSVLDYLEQHFSEDLTSKDIAGLLSYNHSYFCRKFKKIFSQNFADFLNGYRVSKAMVMLKNASVSETATACGFQHISYFSRVFKAISGTAPSEYKVSPPFTQ